MKYILILVHLLKHTNINLDNSKLEDFNLKDKQKIGQLIKFEKL